MARGAGEGAGHRDGARGSDMRAVALIIAGIAVVASGCAGRQHPVGIFAPAPVVAPDRFSARVDAARRQFDDGSFEQARATLDALIAERAPHPLVPFLRARLAEHDLAWEDCILWARRAVEASPGWGEARVLVARACLEAKRVDEADAAFADVDRLLPDNPWGPYGRAWVAARRLDVARGVELADEALRRDPDHRPCLGLRANLARLAGDPAGEERVLRRLDALGEPDAAVIIRLAELAATAGRPVEAARRYERAYELRPSGDLARRRLELARLAGDTTAERVWAARADMP
jgi:predicted Zn-dependent protease